jgi:hypothetical protein
MSSKKRLKTLNLEDDLPTTPEDISALRKARLKTSTDLNHYLRTLSRLKLPENLPRRRKTHEGYQPFTLES